MNPSGESVAILNPASGSYKTGKNLEKIKRKISGAIPSVEFVETKEQGDATHETTRALKDGADLVIAVGGDGTANEVANGFFRIGSDRAVRAIKPSAVMGFLPAGTRNVLARSFSLPEGFEANIERIRTRQEPITTDVLVARVSGNKQRTAPRVFLNAAEIGEGAKISERSKKIRKVIDSRTISTFATVLSTFPTYRSNQCEVSIDGSKWRLLPHITYCIIANGSYIGGGMRMTPIAKLDDGLLDISILKDSGSFKLLGELFRMGVGDLLRDEHLIYRQAKQVSIRSREREVGVTVEGEPIGFLPAEFEVIPRALKFV